MSHVIRAVKARRIFDSRGSETIEVEVDVDGFVGIASSPSGKSRSMIEAEPLPKGGAEEAIRLVRSVIEPKLRGLDVSRFGTVDEVLTEIDGTDRFERIGGNTALAISVATCKAVASSEGKQLYEYLSGELSVVPILPLPLGNVLGGGKHAGSSAPDFQEFLVMPIGAKSIVEALEANITVHRRLGELLSERLPNYPLGRGDEGAYAPPIDNTTALDLVAEAVEDTEMELSIRMGIGLDVAGSNIYDARRRVYRLRSQGLYFDGDEYANFLYELAERYELLYLEDPFWEEDVERFSDLTRSLKRTYVCGDDLVATRAKLIADYSRRGALRAAIIKPNQVGTLRLTWDAVKAAVNNGVLSIASHRSGETEDAFITHVAIGMGCRVLKAGVVGGERVVKANELLRVYERMLSGGQVPKISELTP